MELKVFGVGFPEGNRKDKIIDWLSNIIGFLLFIVLPFYLLFLVFSWLFLGESTTKYTDTEIAVIKKNSELKGFDRGYYAGRRDGKVIICNEIYNEENKPSSCTYTD